MGVPLGFVLGLIFFLFYTNEMDIITSAVSFIRYADDTTIAISDKCEHSLKQTCKSVVCSLMSFISTVKKQT